MSIINLQIQKNLSFIKDNIIVVDSVVDLLIEKDVIPLTERESIISNKTRKDQIQSIVDVVTRKNKGDEFISALNETENNHVAGRISSTQLPNDKDTIRSKTFIKNVETQETMDKIAKELNNTELENKHLRDQQKCLREKLEDYNRRLKQLNSELFKKDARCRELEADNELLKNEHFEMAGKQQEVTALLDEIEKLKMKLNEKDETLNNLDQRLCSVQKQLELNEVLTKVIISDNDRLKKDNDQLKKDNEQLQRECVDIKKICETMSENVSMMMKQNKNTKPVWNNGTRIKNKPTSNTKSKRKY